MSGVFWPFWNGFAVPGAAVPAPAPPLASIAAAAVSGDQAPPRGAVVTAPPSSPDAGRGTLSGRSSTSPSCSR